MLIFEKKKEVMVMMIHFSLENEVQFSLLLTKNLLTSKNDHNFQFLLQSTHYFTYILEN